MDDAIKAEHERLKSILQEKREKLAFWTDTLKNPFARDFIVKLRAEITHMKETLFETEKKDFDKHVADITGRIWIVNELERQDSADEMEAAKAALRTFEDVNGLFVKRDGDADVETFGREVMKETAKTFNTKEAKRKGGPKASAEAVTAENF